MPTRVKDDHKNHNHVLGEISPEMKAFNAELEVLFPDIRYTSGKRKASDGIGTSSKISHHNTGNAEDIAAEHKNVYEYLSGTKEGLQLLTKHGLGIIDETDPETMKKTGATGPHYHIGKDSKYVKQAQDLLLKFEKNPIQSKNVPITPSTVKLTIPSQGILNYVNIDQEAVIETVNEAKEREEVIEKKIEESPERQQIRKKQEERQAIISAIQPTAPIEYEYQDEDTGIPISQIEMQPVQSQLTDLPQIFDLPKMV